MTDNQKSDLDKCLFPYEIVETGQDDLGIDYIEIVEYMQKKVLPTK